MDFGGGAAPAATRLPRVACFLQVQTPSSRHLVRTHTTQWTLLDLNGLSTPLYQQTDLNSSLMKVSITAHTSFDSSTILSASRSHSKSLFSTTPLKPPATRLASSRCLPSSLTSTPWSLFKVRRQHHLPSVSASKRMTRCVIASAISAITPLRPDQCIGARMAFYESVAVPDLSRFII